MPFDRPKLPEVVSRVQGDLNAQLTAAGYTADARIRRTLLWVLARMSGGMLHIAYGVLAWLSRQILPTSSDDEQLVVQAALYGLTKRPAEKSDGNLRFTGTNGSVIPVDHQVVRSDGVVCVVTEAGTLSGSEVTVAAKALEAGDEGNMELGTVLTLATPIAGVDSTCTAVSGEGDWSTGTDIETTEALRARLLLRIAEVPHGGAEPDYVLWAQQVSGVTRAKALPLWRGAGTVDVVFLHEEGTPPMGLPTSPQVAEVQAYLEQVAPVIMDDAIVARAPDVVEVDYTFDSLDPDTSDVRDAIEAELEAMFRARALVSQTLNPSDSYAAITEANGLDGFDLSAPSAPLSCDDDEVFTLGTITWPS